MTFLRIVARSYLLVLSLISRQTLPRLVAEGRTNPVPTIGAWPGACFSGIMLLADFAIAAATFDRIVVSSGLIKLLLG